MPSHHRLSYRAAALAIVSGVLAVGVGFLLRSQDLPLLVRVLLSLVPVAPMLAYCVLLVRGIRLMDELEARVQLEGAVYGLLGTALLIMTLGLLCKGRVLPELSIERLWPWLWIAAFLSWAAGTAIAWRRYR